MNPQILVVSLDFDGCSDKAFSHDKIINNIIKTCSSNLSIQKIIIMIGSLRQSVRLDLINAFHNSCYPHFISCSSLFSVFLPQLQKSIHEQGLTQLTTLEFSPLLLNDIYNQLPTGASFFALQEIFSRGAEGILEFRYLDDCEYLISNIHGDRLNILSLSDAHQMADESKHSIIYTQAHHIKQAHPENDILFQFYDDKKEILEGLHQFFTQTPEELARGIILELVHHQSLIDFRPRRYRSLIEGTGNINHQYHEDIFMIGEEISWNSAPFAENQFKILLEKSKVNTHYFTNTQTYLGLTPPLIIEEHTPVDAYEDIISGLSYYADCQSLFNMAYELKKIEQENARGRAYWETEAEFNSLLEIYHEDEFPGLRFELEEYASFRCLEEKKMTTCNKMQIACPIPVRAMSIFNSPQEKPEAKTPYKTKECPF